jgi:hypothetical protein
LKAHYPLEFAAATLDAESEPDRQIQLLREMKGEGIDYVDVDPDHSGKLWSIANNKLIGPLTSIKGIGPAFVNEIINARKKGIPLRPTIANRLKEAKTDIKTLYPVKAFIERNYPDLESINIVSKVHNLIDIQCGKFGRFEPILAIAIAVRINPRDENEEVNIRRRGGEVVTGPTKYLNMFFRDDTDEIFVKVDRKDFEQYAVPIIERGRPGKAIYAIKGTVPPNFRMISVDRIKYLGDIDQ